MNPATGIYSRDHNATSYSTETGRWSRRGASFCAAEIITLRAIALKPRSKVRGALLLTAEIITLRAIALKQMCKHRPVKVKTTQRS